MADNWLPTISAVAGLLGILTIYLRQKRRTSGEVTHVITRGQRLDALVEHRRARWYHRLTVVALLALPFAQWFCSTAYDTLQSVWFPLVAIMGLMLVVGIFFPRMVPVGPPRHIEWALYGVVLMGGWGVLIALPPTGIVSVLSVLLLDALGLLMVTYLTRLWHTHRLRMPSPD